MSTMSTHAHVSRSSTVRGGLIASAVALVALLAGCGSSSADLSDAGAEAGAEPMYAEASDGGGEDTDRDGAPADDRSLIITGAMYMTVEDPIVAADRAAGIVTNAGGRIDARSETAPDEHYGGSAALTLRIPADDLEEVLDDVRELGTVDELSTNSYDVTNEVTDLEASISTLRASTTRIESLLLEAEDISDIITLENELDDRQAELESLEARQRGLDDQVAMSTIELSLTTEPVVILEEDDPENFLDGLESGWDSLVAFLSGALVIIGVLLPWLALIAVVTLALVVLMRSRKSRRARRETEPATSAKAAKAAKAAKPSEPTTPSAAKK